MATADVWKKINAIQDKYEFKKRSEGFNNSFHNNSPGWIYLDHEGLTITFTISTITGTPYSIDFMGQKLKNKFYHSVHTIEEAETYLTELYGK